jgi:hypothetical protein
MSEFSYDWTTVAAGAVGDQQLNSSGYTQAMAADIKKIMGAVMGFEGVAPNYLNQLVATVTGANTIQIDTGAALVDGHPYKNSAAVSVTIPSAVGAGNTRIDRVVLRCSWAGFTVRVTRIAGTDAASPSAPGITQVSGTTYDIKICQVLVNTSGTCTITDERVTAQVQTAGIAAASIGTAQIAASAGITGAQLAASAGITGAQLAAGANIAGSQLAAAAGITGAQLAAGANIAGSQLAAAAGIVDGQLQYKKVSGRVGGDASNWGTNGANVYRPNTSLIQCGTLRTNGSGLGSASFPDTFSGTPVIVFGAYYGSAVMVSVGSLSTSAFLVTTYVAGGGVAANVDVYWIAIGPP